MKRFGANLTGAEFQMQQGFDKMHEKPISQAPLTPS
jgi:hypothetical protein